MEELKSLIKEQNQLLKEQNQLLVAGFTSLMAFHLYDLEKLLFQADPGEPEVVAHKIKEVATGQYVRQAQAILQKNLRNLQAE